MGVIRLGALTLYRDNPGPPSPDTLADAPVLVEVATQGILDLQAQGAVYWRLFDPHDERALLHQATRIIAEQIGCDIASALARLRSHAFANERRIYDVAEDVISSRLNSSGAP